MGNIVNDIVIVCSAWWYLKSKRGTLSKVYGWSLGCVLKLIQNNIVVEKKIRKYK